jgi:ribosomal protein S18 acetylase RimI-like enzyme
MKEAVELPPPLRIRRGGVGDVDFVRRVAVDVFSHFGDYGRILPGWLLHEGVLTHIAEEELAEAQTPTQTIDRARPVGYTMLGFYPVPREEFVADLLAIAVAPYAQGRGVGKRLLEHAIRHVQAAKRRLQLREMRLSVADSNDRARALFSQFGFEVVEGDHGWYDGGQLALHMVRRL